MKIGVISDTHGSLPAWRTALRHFAGVDLIIHCGDLFYHAPRNPLPEGYAPLELAEAINKSPVPVVIAKGNCDAPVDESLLRWAVSSPFALTRVEGKTLLAWHEGEVDPEAPELLELYRPDVLLVGHTHQARIWWEGDRLCLNPGSPSLSKLPGGTPTVGVLDDDGARIVELRSGVVVYESGWSREGTPGQ